MCVGHREALSSVPLGSYFSPSPPIRPEDLRCTSKPVPPSHLLPQEDRGRGEGRRRVSRDVGAGRSRASHPHRPPSHLCVGESGMNVRERAQRERDGSVASVAGRRGYRKSGLPSRRRRSRAAARAGPNRGRGPCSCLRSAAHGRQGRGVRGEQPLGSRWRARGAMLRGRGNTSLEGEHRAVHTASSSSRVDTGRALCCWCCAHPTSATSELSCGLSEASRCALTR